MKEEECGGEGMERGEYYVVNMLEYREIIYLGSLNLVTVRLLVEETI